MSRGGLGKTFLAVDEGQSPPILCIIRQFWWQNQSIDICVQKAQFLEELSKSLKVPKLLSFFENKEYFYLVEEYIEGAHLANLMQKMGAFEESQIWKILEYLLPILQYIHVGNFIHGDIRPENIISRSSLQSSTEVDFVLVGFGNAIVSASDRLDTVFSSSPEFAAPEQIQGQPVFASDLYSLGVTCIYLLTQISPFDLFDIANDCWVWQQYLTTTRVSERLSKILNKLVQKDINQRFQSADEVMSVMGIYPSQATSRRGVSRLDNTLPISSWRCVHTLTDYSGISSAVNSIAINCLGDTLASGYDDKTINLWDLKTKKVLGTLMGHSRAVTSVAFSLDGKILASASDDKSVKLWDVQKQEEIYTLSGHSHAVKSVAFSPDGEVLASGSWDKTVKIWDIHTGVEICTLCGHQLQVSAVAFSPQGQFLASASLDRNVRLWYIKEFKNYPRYTLSRIFSGHTWAVLTVAFSPDGQVMATGSDDNTIKLWNVNTGQVIGTLSNHSWSVVAVAFSADGEMLMSGSRDKTIKLWRVRTIKEIATLSGFADPVSAVAVSPVAQLIASGSRDKTIKLWEP
ncbi:MAG: WD40 repeat domain-containing serine/threonine-protein kinase [Scytonema sp. PMC 1069.18]|nr:WD40 repeat domain-containing serine/threonine-protein kinase [Scytonema sp. PMC 1069.18]MEC4880052.1 WD40 repeat domain-containing serine/threonine-protein kinase [Scytonema sp. PMC 1070.18]